MKKILFAVALAALMFTACNKEQVPETDNTSKMALPENKEFHASLVLKGEPVKINENRLETIDLTSGREFVLGLVKPSNEKFFVSGTYTVDITKARTETYHLGEYGTLVITDRSGNDWPIVFTNADGEVFEAVATPEGDVVSGDLADKLCRNWKPAALTLSAETEGEIPVGHEFKSADINEVIDFLRDNNVNIDVESVENLEDYNLESISFSESGKIFFNFKNYSLSPFVGTFTLSEGKQENLAYDFSLSYDEIEIIPIKGSGTVTVNDGKLVLYTESDVTANGKTYRVTLTIYCNELK